MNTPIPSQLWKPDVQRQGVGRVGSFVGLGGSLPLPHSQRLVVTSVLAVPGTAVAASNLCVCGHEAVVPLSSPGISPLCVPVPVSLLMRTPVTLDEGPTLLQAYTGDRILTYI